MSSEKSTERRRAHTFKRRLLTLAAMLETPEVAARFYYETYAGTYADNSEKGKPFMGHQNLSCGTTACAIGWAATTGWMRRAGWVLVRSGNVASLENPGTERLGHWAASEQVFGLTKEEAQYLFSPWTLCEPEEALVLFCLGRIPLSNTSSPKLVAKAIRHLAELKYPGVVVNKLLSFGPAVAMAKKLATKAKRKKQKQKPGVIANCRSK